MNEMTTPTDDLAQALHTLLGACAFLTIQSDGRGYFESGQNINRFRQAIADGWKALDSAAHERAQPASFPPDWPDGPDREPPAQPVSVADGWVPVTERLPMVGAWVQVLTDRLAMSRPDLDPILYPNKPPPRFKVVPAQLRDIDSEGCPTWQRWELASGSPCAVIEGDTHWQPLAAAPQPAKESE